MERHDRLHATACVAWGAGTSGQLGDASMQDRHAPGPVLMPELVPQLAVPMRFACGGSHAAAVLDGEGHAACIGHEAHIRALASVLHSLTD